MARTSSARTSPAPCAIAWSRSESASRIDPSAARVTSAMASGATFTPSASAIRPR